MYDIICTTGYTVMELLPVTMMLKGLHHHFNDKAIGANKPFFLLSDCGLMPSEQFFRYTCTMVRTVTF